MMSSDVMLLSINVYLFQFLYIFYKTVYLYNLVFNKAVDKGPKCLTVPAVERMLCTAKI